MKTKLLSICTLLLISLTYSQSGINYKAIVKDGGGTILANQSVDLQFIIYEGVALTNNVYEETHTSAMTDANGLVVVNIGDGTSTGNIGNVVWGVDDHFLNVQIDTGSGLIDLGTTQFQAVPYAYQAQSVSGAISINDLEDGKTDTNETSTYLGREAGLLDDDTDNNNVGIGNLALSNNTSGLVNVGVGSFSLLQNTTGRNNTAVGVSALTANTTGGYNVAVGTGALFNNTTAFNNTALGESALSENTTGQFNTAVGKSSLLFNNGNQNTAVGFEALRDNVSASLNTAIGLRALASNTTGQFNSALGHNSLVNNTVGFSNNAFGLSALQSNVDGDWNNAFGGAALLNNSTGNANCAFGDVALNFNETGSYNVALGHFAMHGNVAGNNNVAVGHGTMTDLTEGENNIAIGAEAQVPNSTGSNQIRMGDTNITSADIQVAWNVTSDARWKNQIRDLPFGMNLLNQLRPVDYVRKNNENRTREMGFIAQEVREVLKGINYEDQGFLTEDDNGYLSLRYNDLIPVLVKAIQEQRKHIISLEQQLTNQNEINDQIYHRLKALEAKNNRL